VLVFGFELVIYILTYGYPQTNSIQFSIIALLAQLQTAQDSKYLSNKKSAVGNAEKREKNNIRYNDIL
jgi:hypothetical protein